MTADNIFKTKQEYTFISSGKVSSQCSSNIALVKYWGKFPIQIPANTSISYTLKNSYTQTELFFEKSETLQVEVFLEEQKQEEFAHKIEKYFKTIEEYLPFITKYKYTIKTHNSFPHSSGIASSASGFGAIALCLMEMAELLGEKHPEQEKQQKASFLARIGSGSACRSIYNGLVVWGEHPKIPGSSDLFATPFPFKVHSVFKNMNDYILLIHEGKKDVSSTIGHGLMKNHPYAETRFKDANQNISKISEILEQGNLATFGELIEHEALTLHAMMMMSTPAFILMKPATVAAIQKIWEYRKLSGSHLYFTLDAGANIHLIFPEEERIITEQFIQNVLIKYTENGNLIKDKVNF